MLSASPSIPVIGPQGTFVAAGMLTIGGPVLIGAGTVNVPNSGSPTNSATGTGGTGGVATNSGTSGGGAVATTASPPTNSAGNPTTSAGNATNTAGNPTNSAGNATNTAGKATTTANANPGTQTNAGSGPSSIFAGGGIPVFTGQLTLVNSTVATNSATSGGLTAAATPVPASIETITGDFVGLEGAVAGAAVSDSISTLPTTFVAQNAKDASPVAKAGDLVASLGGSVSAASSLLGTSSSGSLLAGQNANQGGGPNRSTIASTANIANPAPNSIFLKPDQVSSEPETITFDPLPGTRELPGSTTPDDVGAAAPSEATGKAGGAVDIDFDVEQFRTDQAVAAPSTDATVTSVSTATDSRVDLLEIGQVTTSGSVSPIDPAHGGDAKSSVGEVVIMTSMVATYSANLAFGGAVLNYGTMSWATRRWPATRRFKGAERPSPKVRSR